MAGGNNKWVTGALVAIFVFFFFWIFTAYASSGATCNTAKWTSSNGGGNDDQKSGYQSTQGNGLYTPSLVDVTDTFKSGVIIPLSQAGLTGSVSYSGSTSGFGVTTNMNSYNGRQYVTENINTQRGIETSWSTMIDGVSYTIYIDQHGRVFRTKNGVTVSSLDTPINEAKKC